MPGGWSSQPAVTVATSSQDHSEFSMGAAATMAHEIGHSLGLSHDPHGCCAEAAVEQGGCVMAAATGYPRGAVVRGCGDAGMRGCGGGAAGRDLGLPLLTFCGRNGYPCFFCEIGMMVTVPALKQAKWVPVM